MKILRVVAIISLFAVLVSLVSCASVEKSIVGTWRTKSNLLGLVTDSTIRFNSDGSGARSTVLGIEEAFTYTIDKDKLTITTNTLGIKSTVEYTVTIKGDVLTLAGDGNTVEYTKDK